MIQRLSQVLAVKIKSQTPDHPTSYDVLVFSLMALLNVIAGVVLSILISIFTGKIIETIIGLAAFAVLRQISGGAHLKSGDLCVIVSAVGATIVSFSSFDPDTVLWMTTASMILAALFSPSNIERQTRIPKKYFPLLKITSVLLITSNLFIGSSVIASAFLLQCLTLLIKGKEVSET